MKKKKIGSSQDGGIGRNLLLLHTTKRRKTTNLKSINNQKHQKIKLHGTLTTKELKKKSARTTRPIRTCGRTRRWGWLKANLRLRVDCGLCQGLLRWEKPQVSHKRKVR